MATRGPRPEPCAPTTRRGSTTLPAASAALAAAPCRNRRRVTPQLWSATISPIMAQLPRPPAPVGPGRCSADGGQHVFGEQLELAALHVERGRTLLEELPHQPVEPAG